ncbi:MAG: hypothetical protein PUB10_07975 [Clostridiales bacterium]|nr:hypothetical protein [Clostridiales bacterium]
MGRQIRLLTKLSVCNLFGWNEIRFTKDAKKKARYGLMGGLWVFLIGMLVLYVCSTSYGLCYLKMGSLVPAVLSMCVSVVVFMFTLFKAGPVLFDQRAYERQITLPVTVQAVIVSRFLSMYLTCLLLGLLVMLPGMVVYGVLEQPGFFFYLYGIIGCLFLPLLPLTAASVIGAVITGISVRWKKKKLVEIVLSLLAVCVLFFGSIWMSRMEETEMKDFFLHLADLLEKQIGTLYPPAVWLSKAMVDGRIGELLLFLSVSFGCFLVFLFILQAFYEKICNCLSANEASRDYEMKTLSIKPVRQSMVERELCHYFSSTVYVTNTMVGYVLMVVITLAVVIMGTEKLEHMVGLPGIVERVLPVMLGAMPVLMPISSSSISMEGKQWWLIQTLPVQKKDVIQSKIWANLIVVFPFYLVSEMIALIALKPGVVSACCLLVVPAVYIVFGARMGVLINLIFPVFDWDNETRVVKQSAATFVTMLAGAIVGMVPLAVLIYSTSIPALVVDTVVVLVLVVVMFGAEHIYKRRWGQTW